MTSQLQVMASMRHRKYEGICADFAHTDGFVEIELDDRHLVVCALFAEKSAAMSAAIEREVQPVTF